MSGKIEAYYDEFTENFVRDFIEGNERVRRQLRFFHGALPAAAEKVLVVGCGSGEGAYHVACQGASNTEVLAVDLSGKAIEIAQRLFPHPRVEYRKLDVLTEHLEGSWDAILLPDVYEHIPSDRRGDLHARLRALLAHDGVVLITVPSPGKQEALRVRGDGLQIIDETVTAMDIAKMGDELGAPLSYMRLVSVWEQDDYMHAVLSRGAARVAPLARRPEGLVRRARRFLDKHIGHRIRRRRVQRALGGLRANTT
ncbi:MAG: class I SAM-dependent methyltransferase [Planctomycetota bacterium]